MISFQTKLDHAIDRSNSLLCIGLDSDHHKLPAGAGQFLFNQGIIDATADLVCAYKPNPAFYEALGAEGVANLKQTCDYIRAQHPHIPLIIDSKRADIGNTNNGYAEYLFDYLGADAVTVPPYMGQESLQPLLNRRDKGIIVLCRTSNPGAGELQDLPVGESKLFLQVAERVKSSWNTHGNCLLVVGATYPAELTQVRDIVGPDMPLLIPGAGTQGGDIAQVTKAGLGARRRGLIINASRSVIFASNGPDYAQAARKAAAQLRDEINSNRQEVRA